MYYKDYSIDKYAKGGIFKDKLIGSSSNPEGILKLLKQFFYSPNIFLTEDEISDNYYVINNAKGVIKNYYVFFSKGRYRLYEKDKVDFDERIKEQREKSEILNKQNKLKNKNFVDIMADFLLNNKIKGTPTTYGFNINRTPDFKERLRESEDKLEKLGIKYQLDFSNQWNVMFKLSKKDFKIDKGNNIVGENIREANKNTDEEKSIETLLDTEPQYFFSLPKSLIEEIKESVKLGFDKLETGMIAPKKKGILLVNKDYHVRGTYNLELKIPIQKIIDETKTKDIEEVEITKDNNIDKLIKALQTSLKYSGANTRSKIEEQISALRIAQKYEMPNIIDSAEKKIEGGQNQDEIAREMADGGMMAKGGKFKEYKPKFLKEGYDYGKKAYHNGINAAFYDTEFNSFLKENVYPKKDNKIVIDYLYSYNKGWHDENYKNTDWLVKGND